MNQNERARRHAKFHQVFASTSDPYAAWSLAGREGEVYLPNIDAYIAMYRGADGLPVFAFFNLGREGLRAVDLAYAAFSCEISEADIDTQMEGVRASGTFIYDGDPDDDQAFGLAVIQAAAEKLADDDLPVAFVALLSLPSGHSQLMFAYVKGMPLGFLWGAMRLGAPAGLLGV